MSRSLHPRSLHGGRHELGQNFLHHPPTLKTILKEVRATRGPILELGAGDGALTRPLASLHRAVTAIDIDEHRVTALQESLPQARIIHADALTYPLRQPVIVGNIPFHLTTPILKRLLRTSSWKQAILVTQWEVARKRAGVGGRTMMTAQEDPWYRFDLLGRVPRRGFRPAPSVDGGVLSITRRGSPLIPTSERREYQRFVRSVFTGRGGKLERIVQNAARLDRSTAVGAVDHAQARGALPRDLTPEQWVIIWNAIGGHAG